MYNNNYAVHNTLNVIPKSDKIIPQIQDTW